MNSTPAVSLIPAVASGVFEYLFHAAEFVLVHGDRSAHAGLSRVWLRQHILFLRCYWDLGLLNILQPAPIPSVTTLILL